MTSAQFLLTHPARLANRISAHYAVMSACRVHSHVHSDRVSEHFRSPAKRFDGNLVGMGHYNYLDLFADTRSPSYFRRCKKCGARIHMREMPHGQWVAFDGRDSVHSCGQPSEYDTLSPQRRWNKRRRASLSKPTPQPPLREAAAELQSASAQRERNERATGAHRSLSPRSIRVLWLAAIVGILILLTLLPRSSQRPASTTSKMAATAPPVSLTERLRHQPPVLLAVAGGTAWLLAALEPDERSVRLLLRFEGDNERKLLNGSVVTVAGLLHPSLCGATGLLEQYRLAPQSIVLVAYEGQTRVGDVHLGADYCRR